MYIINTFIKYVHNVYIYVYMHMTCTYYIICNVYILYVYIYKICYMIYNMYIYYIYIPLCICRERIYVYIVLYTCLFYRIITLYLNHFISLMSLMESGKW